MRRAIPNRLIEWDDLSDCVGSTLRGHNGTAFAWAKALRQGGVPATGNDPEKLAESLTSDLASGASVEDYWIR
jgi:hypothetical protein